jgi:5-methylcytosine-specific restriction endonuclease McrA
LKYKYPEGKLEDVMGEAIELLLKMKDPIRQGDRRRKKVVSTARAFVQKYPVEQISQNPSRYIPAKIRHAVYVRDQAKCSYVSKDGKKCHERGSLELDHIQPFALGGSNSVGNLRLLCRNHNQWRGMKTFGVYKSLSPAKVKLTAGRGC